MRRSVQRCTHWCKAAVFCESDARSSTKRLTRGSCHPRRKFAQISLKDSRRKSPQTNGSALMSLTSPFGSTISKAAGCCRR